MKTSRNAIILLIIAGFAGIVIYSMMTGSKQQNHKKFHAIIFDMDGTTLDTDHLWKFSNGPILDSHAPHLTTAEKNFIHLLFMKSGILYNLNVHKKHP